MSVVSFPQANEPVHPNSGRPQHPLLSDELPGLEHPEMVAGDTREVYESLREAGLDALNGGHFGEAYRLFDEALETARRLGDSTLQDRAFCNRAAVAIEIMDPQEPLQQLRCILTARKDLENSRLAAYNIARIHERTKQYKKGLFYARTALDLSELLGRPDWIASSHNRIGNLLMAESYFEEACTEYDVALRLFEPMPSVQRAILLENVGYCRVVQGRLEEGFELLYRGLRMLRRLKARGFQAYPHLSLCYAHIEAGRHRDALRHGTRALALAHRVSDSESIKYALFLLGEAANLSGDAETARDYLLELQREYYPDSPEIVNFLLAVDIRPLINIKA
ncbi:MAG: hypothetical protein SX243_03635 [Acidobacteriota bacterium]|nr:hypothetical protein [Acidobacteriota bacterium]